MVHSYKFCVVQFPAHPARDERLNLALAVFHKDSLEIHVSRRLEKLKAISAALDTDIVRESVCHLADLDTILRESGAASEDDRLGKLASMATFRFSPLGDFVAGTRPAYDAQIALLLKQLVEPEPAPLKQIRHRSTPLLRSVKSSLKTERILAKKNEGLETHRVVPNHVIAEGLSADLMLKNGAWHVIQTIDASGDDTSVKRVIQSIGFSALVFEQARMVYGSRETDAKLVYQASAALERSLTPSLLAAEHQGAKLVNWDSTDDQRKLITNLSKLAEPAEDRRLRDVAVHASNQHRFKLN